MSGLFITDFWRDHQEDLTNDTLTGSPLDYLFGSLIPISPTGTIYPPVGSKFTQVFTSG